jgi:hypothetical protein
MISSDTLWMWSALLFEVSRHFELLIDAASPGSREYLLWQRMADECGDAAQQMDDEAYDIDDDENLAVNNDADNVSAVTSDRATASNVDVANAGRP